jgi:catechol 2,3-dioxygenase-like lactoylglutathione lyase family enzyme
MATMLRTPNLPRAVADYTGVLGFECRQHIPGVLALLEHGSLCVQLWACSAPAGRWEKPDPHQRAWAPGHHRAVVCDIQALYASIQSAIMKPVRTTLSGTQALHAHRLPASAPSLQPWGAWEFAFTDVDGHTIHCVDWGVGLPAPAAHGRQRPGSDATPPRTWRDDPQGGAPHG